MRKAGFVIMGMILIILMGSFPNAHAAGPTINHQAVNNTPFGTTGTVIMTIDTVGDSVVVGIETCDPVGTFPVSITSVTDGTDVFTQIKTTNDVFSLGTVDIWATTSTVTGSKTITATYASSTFCVISMESIDVTGVPSTATSTLAAACITPPCSTTINTAPSSLNLFSDSLAFAAVFADCQAGGPTCTPGAGYSYNVPSNGAGEGAAEYGIGVNSPTNFPLTQGSTNDWAEVGAIFVAGTVVVVVPCTFTQLQCWWYPLLFYGVFGSAFLLIGRAGTVDGRSMTYLLLAGLAYCSLIQVQMNMTNIMMPMILSIIGIVYSVRGR